MKRNTATLFIGIFLLLIFGLQLFCFQVRQTEVALVTRFGKPSRHIKEPGLKGKLPWPIEKVQKFDKRVQHLEDKTEETQTREGWNILVRLFVGWSISDPTLFRERFNDSTARAEAALEGLIRTEKDAVIGQHPFSHFLSADEKELRLAQIENEILAAIQPQAKTNYGVDLKFVHVKRLQLPESITAKVFDRMREERQRFVQKLRAEGDSQADIIRSMADRDRAKLLAEADAQAGRLRGEAEAEAGKFYAVFEQNPELAVLLMKISALETSLKDRSTLVLDQRVPPLDLVNPITRPSAQK